MVQPFYPVLGHLPLIFKVLLVSIIGTFTPLLYFRIGDVITSGESKKLSKWAQEPGRSNSTLIICVTSIFYVMNISLISSIVMRSWLDLRKYLRSAVCGVYSENQVPFSSLMRAYH